MINQVLGYMLQCPRCAGHWIRTNKKGTAVCRKCALELNKAKFFIHQYFDPDNPPKGVFLNEEEYQGIQVTMEGVINGKTMPPERSEPGN